jgi:NitT/TauT family transport system substrate-binding protein
MDKAGVKNLGWVGNETPWQIGAIFVTTKSANERQDTIARFLRALAKGARDYHDAFTDTRETRADGPKAQSMLAVMTKYLGSTPEELSPQMPYVDPRLSLDEKDVGRQIDWYKAQGMVKGDITVERLIDKRYVSPLP